jgi:hypothetical protein
MRRITYTVSPPPGVDACSVAVHWSADWRPKVKPPRAAPSRTKCTLVPLNSIAIDADRALRLYTTPVRHSILEESLARANVESGKLRITIVESSTTRYSSKKAG